MRTAITACLVFVSAARAGLSPESVAVVVNADSWASLSVANEYARLRHIPDGNFIMVSGLSSFDFTDVTRFRAEILSPVLAELDARGLRGQIDCITYSLDIPCAAAVNADMAGGKFHQVITPVASANGLTYLYEAVLQKDATAYLDLDANRYARRTLPLALGARLNLQQRGEYLRGMALYDAKKYAEAADAISSVVFPTTPDPDMLYNLACCQALAGRAEEALATLRAAVTAGWRNHGQASSDPDFASIASRDEFKKLVEGMKAVEVKVQAGRGFDALTGWSLSGDPDASGPRYVLSTFLGVASGRANSVNEVLGSLVRAADADATAPRGTIYFLKNGDVRSTTRDWAFPSAQKALGALDVACLTEDGVLPASRDDVAGAVIGISDFDWATSKSKILPGAICEHLTSCGGMMGERDGQTPCTEFIRAGAAGTSGAVTEPYALQQKFPDAFVQARYAAGCTLAEAFYQSVRGPYQLLIIGDPLCAPWSKAGRASLSGFPAKEPLKGEVRVRMGADGGAVPVRNYELFIDGRRTTSIGVPAAKDGGTAKAGDGAEFVLDTTGIPDGEHVMSLVAVHSDAIETHSRTETVIRVANGGRAVRVTKKPAPSVVFGRPVRMELSCEGAERIDVMHLGRVVASVEGPIGVAEIDTALLGVGSVELRPVGRFGKAQDREIASSSVRGGAIRVEVSPRVIAGKGGAGGEKGLTLWTWTAADSADSGDGGKTPKGEAVAKRHARPADAKGVAVTETFDPAWIASAGVQPGQAFELVGSFEAAEQDLYQFQLRTNLDASVEVDGEQILHAGGDAWRYAGARLGSGRHVLRITGVAGSAGGSPRLDIRLGARGTAHPTDKVFRREGR